LIASNSFVRIEKAGPGRNVGDIGNPEPRRLRREVALDQVRRMPATILDRGGDEPASAHTSEAGLRHPVRPTRSLRRRTLHRRQGPGARIAPAPATVQVETEENVPDCDAELAVVLWVKVPVTVAVVPEAVLVNEKLADPTPPGTCSISASLSSIRISAIR